jgi:hypothetical protein
MERLEGPGESGAQVRRNRGRALLETGLELPSLETQETKRRKSRRQSHAAEPERALSGGACFRLFLGSHSARA